MELAGIFFVEEQRLNVQAVEQEQTALAIGRLDQIGIPPEPLRQASHHLAHIRRGGSP